MFRKITDYIINPFLLFARAYDYISNYIKERNKGSEMTNSYTMESEVISAVKNTVNKSSNVSVSHSFMEGSKAKEKDDTKNRKPSIKSMDLSNPYVLDKLRGAIIISPYEEIDLMFLRKDLEFVGVSRITGRGIFKYIGNDFAKFDLPYEEIFF